MLLPLLIEHDGIRHHDQLLASSPIVMSMTMRRVLHPIWGAARPTPGAAYIVCTMSSARLSSSPGKSVISSERMSSSAAPNFTMGLNVIIIDATLDTEFESISLEPKGFDRQIRANDRDSRGLQRQKEARSDVPRGIELQAALCASASRFEIASPSPAPGASRSRRKKGSKMSSRCLARNAAAIVADFDVEMAISMLNVHTDKAALSGELDRVIDEVGEDAFGRKRIAASFGLGGLDLEPNAPGLGYRAKAFFDPREHGRKWPRVMRLDRHVELEESRHERFERLDFKQTV